MTWFRDPKKKLDKILGWNMEDPKNRSCAECCDKPAPPWIILRSATTTCLGGVGVKQGIKGISFEWKDIAITDVIRFEYFDGVNWVAITSDTNFNTTSGNVTVGPFPFSAPPSPITPGTYPFRIRDLTNSINSNTINVPVIGCS